MSPRAIPQALRPLPIRVRPRPAETVASYVVRLARANHLEPSYLHAYLCGPPDWHGAADLQRLAVLCGRPVAVLQRTLTGPTPARKPTPKPPSRPSKSPTPLGTATPHRPREPAAGSGHHNQPLEVGAAPTTPTSLPAPDGMAHPMGGWTGRLVDRKVWGTGVIGYAGAHYSVGRPFVGQTVQVGCADGMVHIFHGGQPLRAWPRRHPPANEASIQPARSHHDEMDLDQARRLAPLDDLDSDPRVVHRLVDPTGSVSVAGRCAWQQRHTPQQEQRMHQRPNIQQRTANARALTPPHTSNQRPLTSPDPPLRKFLSWRSRFNGTRPGSADKAQLHRDTAPAPASH